jgi:hypothetical protein
VTSHAVRRAIAAVSAITAGLVVPVLLAGPASADPPTSWPTAPSVDFLQVLLLFVGIPVLMMIVIVAMVLGPSLARGESLSPRAPEEEAQWLGGPRKAPDELAAPDSEGSQAGGAGGTW